MSKEQEVLDKIKEDYDFEDIDLIQELIDKHEKLREYIFKNLDFAYYSQIEESGLSVELKNRYNKLGYSDGLQNVLSFLDNKKGFSDDY